MFTDREAALQLLNRMECILMQLEMLRSVTEGTFDKFEALEVASTLKQCESLCTFRKGRGAFANVFSGLDDDPGDIHKAKDWIRQAINRVNNPEWVDDGIPF